MSLHPKEEEEGDGDYLGDTYASYRKKGCLDICCFFCKVTWCVVTVFSLENNIRTFDFSLSRSLQRNRMWNTNKEDKKKAEKRKKAKRRANTYHSVVIPNRCRRRLSCSAAGRASLIVKLGSAAADSVGHTSDHKGSNYNPKHHVHSDFFVAEEIRDVAKLRFRALGDPTINFDISSFHLHFLLPSCQDHCFLLYCPRYKRRLHQKNTQPCLGFVMCHTMVVCNTFCPIYN